MELVVENYVFTEELKNKSSPRYVETEKNFTTEVKHILAAISPLYDPVTWYKIKYTGEQVAQWDFQNKDRSRRAGTNFIVLEVPLRNLLTSIFNFVPCDRIVQRAYSLLTDLSFSETTLKMQMTPLWHWTCKLSAHSIMRVCYRQPICVNRQNYQRRDETALVGWLVGWLTDWLID